MNSSAPSHQLNSVLGAIRGIADFRGNPTEYWRRLAEIARDLSGADACYLYWRKADPSGGGAWKVLESVRAGGEMSLLAAPELRSLVPARMLSEARMGGVAFGPAEAGAPCAQVGVVALQVADPTMEVVLVAALPEVIADPKRGLGWLMVAGWLPLAYERDRNARAAKRDSARLAQSIELVGRILEADTFEAACLILANELSQTFACETVSVTWRARGGLRLRAISHAEKVDRRSDLSALVEEAGQEALTQETEIHWPGRSKAVSRAHDHYARLQHPGHMITLPLIDFSSQAGGPDKSRLGAITLERQRASFSAAELWALRLACELALQPLIWQAARARRLPVRVGTEIMRSLPRALRPRTTSGRRLAALLVLLLGGLAAMPVPYSISGSATIQADAMAFIGAPFDGFLEESYAEQGDIVAAGMPLFSLATQELMLEKSALLADLVQSDREAELRRSLSQLPQMQIAEAQAAETRVKLEQTDVRLASAVAHAPFSGVVVEGEPGKQIGGAVRRGDPVLTVAALNSLHVQGMIHERDLSRLALGQPVRVTFIAQPKDTFEMFVDRIIPAARIEDGANRFPIRLTPPDSPSEWWLPGMTGVVKVSVGWRPIGWIATHRLFDYLRLVFWI